jgi:hypothetical protein
MIVSIGAQFYEHIRNNIQLHGQSYRVSTLNFFDVNVQTILLINGNQLCHPFSHLLDSLLFGLFLALFGWIKHFSSLIDLAR